MLKKKKIYIIAVGLISTMVGIAGLYGSAMAVDLDPETGFVGCKGIDCDLCKFLDMIDRIIDYGIEFSFILGAAIVTVGGLWMLLAGAAQGIQKGKDIMVEGLIGLGIILGAWLAVNFTIQMIIPEDARDRTGGYPTNWFNVDCEALQESVVKEPYEPERIPTLDTPTGDCNEDGCPAGEICVFATGNCISETPIISGDKVPNGTICFDPTGCENHCTGGIYHQNSSGQYVCGADPNVVPVPGVQGWPCDIRNGDNDCNSGLACSPVENPHDPSGLDVWICK